jgi:hypothetical protein
MNRLEGTKQCYLRPSVPADGGAIWTCPFAATRTFKAAAPGSCSRS